MNNNWFKEIIELLECLIGAIVLIGTISWMVYTTVMAIDGIVL